MRSIKYSRAERCVVGSGGLFWEIYDKDKGINLLRSPWITMIIFGAVYSNKKYTIIIFNYNRYFYGFHD